MRVHRLQSPFENWLSGLAFELLAFAVFLAALAVLVYLVAWAV